MFCTNCGSQIDDKALICPHCGVATQNYKDSLEKGSGSQKNGMAIAGFVCSFFIPLLGWIFGGIGLSRANKRNGKHKGLAIASIIISTVMFFVNMATMV